jgi:hypothetical protein
LYHTRVVDDWVAAHGAVVDSGPYCQALEAILIGQFHLQHSRRTIGFAGSSMRLSIGVQEIDSRVRSCSLEVLPSVAEADNPANLVGKAAEANSECEKYPMEGSIYPVCATVVTPLIVVC